MSMTELNEQIKNCRKCRMWQGAKNAVPGEGPLHARIMLVGQNPGAEEDRMGKPFVGRAGKYLNVALNKVGVEREELYVTNIVKHVTPKNRKPLPDEIAACVPYLTAQVNEIKPRTVVLMGAVARQTPRSEGVTYVETYHPSAAMRFPKIRKKFDEDLRVLKGYL
jgi:uracil-DNA glycosylase family 4